MGPSFYEGGVVKIEEEAAALLETRAGTNSADHR